jgi:hypothetical protein
MDRALNHSQSLQEGTNCPSPITHVIALGYYDGPTEGVLRLGESGEVYRFLLLDEIQPADPDAVDIRLFGLSRLPPQTWDSLIDMLSPYLKPHWPVWVPLWRFPTEAVRKQIDTQVDALLGSAGPVAWKVTTTDLLGTLQQVQRGTDTPEIHRPDQ